MGGKDISVEENTNHSEKLVEEIVKDKDHTETLQEVDEIMKDLGGKDIIEEENTNHSEKLTEDIVEDKDHTEMEEADNIMKILLDMHEEVPLEDPGPSVDRAEGAAGATQLGVGGYIEDPGPGPNIAIEDRKAGVAGATQ